MRDVTSIQPSQATVVTYLKVPKSKMATTVRTATKVTTATTVTTVTTATTVTTG